MLKTTYPFLSTFHNHALFQSNRCVFVLPCGCNSFFYLISFLPYRNLQRQWKVCFIILKPANGILKQISGMFAATSKERSHDGSSPVSKSGSKVERKSHSPKVTSLPPFSETGLSASFGAKCLFSSTFFPENIPSNKPKSLLRLPCLVGEVGSERATAEGKWTSLGTDIPVGVTQLKLQR